MDISIKTSLESYLVSLLISSPFLIIIPVVLVYQGKYIDSNFWPMHIFLVVLTFIFFMYISQTVHIAKECITLRKPSIFGTRTIKMYFGEVSSWNAENRVGLIIRREPVRLFTGSKEVMLINWTMFSNPDQKLLIDFLLNSGIKRI